MKIVKIIFALFFVNLFIVEVVYPESQSDWIERFDKRPVNMSLGIKGNYLITIDTLNHGDVNFIANNSSGFGLGGGLYTEFTFFKIIAFETGFYYRTAEYAGWEVDYDEIYIPLILKGRYQIDEQFSLLFGGGVGYFNTLSGSIDPTGDGPGQGKYSFQDSDLKDGFSLIVLLETQIDFYRKHLIIGLRYERAKKVLNIIENNITIDFGIGFKLF